MEPIFVFRSNLAGRHGKGAALHARSHHGAVYGIGVGMGKTDNASKTALEAISAIFQGKGYPKMGTRLKPLYGLPARF